jgi:hypothetical protein
MNETPDRKKNFSMGLRRWKSGGEKSKLYFNAQRWLPTLRVLQESATTGEWKGCWKPGGSGVKVFLFTSYKKVNVPLNAYFKSDVFINK